VVILGIILLFYAVHQLGTTSWLPLYLETEHQFAPAIASAALSVYWIGIILSRYLASVFGARIGEARLLLWGSIAGGAVLLGAVLVPSGPVAIAGFVLTGIITGATIPVAMSVAYERLPERTGSVTSIVYGLMMIGRLVGPWSIGLVGDRLGLGAGIVIAAAVLLAAGALSIWVAATNRRFAEVPA
jgi:fucose permease